jgi:hypothetical protein
VSVVESYYVSACGSSCEEIRCVLDDGDCADVVCSIGVGYSEDGVCPCSVDRGIVGYCPAEPVPVGVVSEEGLVSGHTVVLISGLSSSREGEGVPLTTTYSTGDDLVSARVLTESFMVLDGLDPGPSLGSVRVVRVQVTLSSPGDVVCSTRHIEVFCVVSVPERVPARIVGSWNYVSGRS